ncbi:cytochrome P450 [Irpex rosettiformis]|uniref:Cytochrome P450 n=1 Tax=Irpex rosettiformis TaxID=378272 RepID=A0ACB8UF85_9APHY|nr:cytochrome P450 [Irpex rosettiformis]
MISSPVTQSAFQLIWSWFHMSRARKNIQYIYRAEEMSSLTILGGILLCAVAVRLALRKRLRLCLPPSPPADVLIGHLRVLPDPQVTPEVFYKWSLKYGDVFSLSVPGKTIIVVNSEKAANELLEKRSAIYSDRARMAYYDYIGWKDAVIFAPYGPFHARQRKLYQDAFGKNVVSEYRSIQEREANTLLKGLLDEPANFDSLSKRFAGGVVTEIGYGHRIDSFTDGFFSVGDRFAKIAGMGANPSLLDLHPIFAYLPSWAPGAATIKFIKETKPFMDAIVHDNHKKVVQQMKNGTARLSFTAKHLEAAFGKEHDSEEERAVRLGAAMIFTAGFETTWHFLVIFIAAMLLHPDAQQKAREELDRVVGRDRLPDFNDRESLQYVQCVINEVLRWNPVNPIGFPHRVMEDDVYNGMHIPKGAIVIPNTRAFTWEQSKFHDAKLFKPQRFLPKPEGSGEVLPPSLFWGWGRRVCAGRYLAEGSLFTAVSRILAVFTISPLKDAKGHLIQPEIKFITNTSRHTEPFTCNIQPRDVRARDLIIESCQD